MVYIIPVFMSFDLNKKENYNILVQRDKVSEKYKTKNMVIGIKVKNFKY